MLNKRIEKIEIPSRMRSLPISDEGYPIPWFVPILKGKPDFRCMDGRKLEMAVRHQKCWLCGFQMGRYLTFPIGPMCIVNRTVSEPPSHLECAEYGAKACPFLAQPKMKRNEKIDLPENRHIAGESISRNPGVICLWTTLSYRLFQPSNGGVLFRLGDPEHIEFYAEGRRATLGEVMQSMESGLPLLAKLADGKEAMHDLFEDYNKAVVLVTTCGKWG